MSEYYFKNEEFVIENFHKQKTFSSFLPGLAGRRGIPLWAFYVNRGQGIASFGVENKDNQILEFFPAVSAYQNVGTNGFRTFIKLEGVVHEIFGENQDQKETKMRIKRGEFSIEETNHTLGIKVEVTYFGLPNESIAALVRQVQVTNLLGKPLNIELVDGLSQLLPYKTEYGSFKSMSNLLRSWMEVYSLENNVGFYRMRSSSSDSAVVEAIVKGNFYLSTFENKLVRPVVDQSLVFGYDTSKRYARRFETSSIKEMTNSEQVTANKIPVGFTCVETTLLPNEPKQINTVIGHVHSEEHLLSIVNDISSQEYLNTKRLEASQVLDEILDEIATETAFPIFDDYMKQNYLDNLLRGGYPMVINNEKHNFVYHLFSRRHGDLERDYNYFSLAPEFYSQGNGNFRDVCQNRRSDILFNKNVEDFNVKMFGSFIQADGYNPLGINGSSFKIESKKIIDSLTKKRFEDNEEMRRLLSGKFTPGSVVNTMANLGIKTTLSDQELFEEVFQYADQVFEADFGEGYWIDHWTYILDLVENYQAIYPDKLKDTLYNDISYAYYDSPVHVLPRSEKIYKRADGEIRRYDAIVHHDHEKIQKLQMNPHGSNWLKDQDGLEVKASLYAKLFVLTINKIASLDPSGMGIEMEANKPGWNDAMNGLPGLFGSGVSETIELKRIAQFLQEQYDASQNLELPVEFIQFVKELKQVFTNTFNDFDYWNQASSVKEEYRNNIRFGTDGIALLSSKELYEVLELVNRKIDLALSKALRHGDGVYPTYLVHEVTKYEPIMENNSPKIGRFGLPLVKPLEFKVRALPYYLEAPARALKVMKNQTNKKTMFDRVKMSNIYDHELKFYKTSEFLDNETNEIGRGRSFTKGWQERESNFLHMTYKYLVGLLKGGLYNEFFEEIKTNLTCFMDPKVYGRSTLENSSFIAPSINPDPEVRGQGWVARLSGSTAEMLSIWQYMMFGKKPFIMEQGELKLNLHPILSKEFFKDGKVSFTFLGNTKITYVNNNSIDTYTDDFSITGYKYDDSVLVDEITGELAHKLRDGQIKHLTVYIGG